MPTPVPALPITLQRVRKARRLSQLELSFRLRVSKRHVSFVESGRAKPSRELLAAWLHELDAPLTVRNEAMLQAGCAPAYGAAPLGDPSLTQANAALEQLLRAHDPMPALVLDAQWNLVRPMRGRSTCWTCWRTRTGSRGHSRILPRWAHRCSLTSATRRWRSR